MVTLKKEYWKTPEATAVIAAFLVGLVAHLFGLVNVIYNFDNIDRPFFGTGDGVHSGRWMLQIMGEFMEWAGLAHNLPLLGGLSFLLLISISAGFVVSCFHLRSRTSAALLGMIFTVFPPVVATMYYRYTTFHYGVGILLAVLSAWVLPRYKRLGFPLSVLLMAASMGIYQAYAPLTITLMVLQLMQQCLDTSMHVPPPPRNYLRRPAGRCRPGPGRASLHVPHARQPEALECLAL